MGVFSLAFCAADQSSGQTQRLQDKYYRALFRNQAREHNLIQALAKFVPSTYWKYVTNDIRVVLYIYVVLCCSKMTHCTIHTYISLKHIKLHVKL